MLATSNNIKVNHVIMWAQIFITVATIRLTVSFTKKA